MNPSCSIVIPCRQEERFIGTCLNSLLFNGLPEQQMEILVVDGMSTDRTREIIQEETPKLVRQIIQEETPKIVKEIVKSELKPIKRKINKIDKTLNVAIKLFDEYQTKLQRRVDKIESHLGF